MLPFAAAALILACVTLAASVSSPRSPSVVPSVAALTEADYISHCLFQATFSQRPLHRANASGADSAEAGRESGGMGYYELDPDGLLIQTADSEPSMYATTESLLAAIPPFPLADFFMNINTSDKASGLHNLLLTLIPFIFIVPLLKMRKKG
jgi:hypothetical protein